MVEENKDIYENVYKCPICLNLLYNPISIPCGHSFCQECFNTYMSYSQECPVCKEKYFLTNTPRVNLVLKETIESKYPDIVKKIKASKEQNSEHKENSENSKLPETKKYKCCCVRKINTHLMPKENLTLRLNNSFANEIVEILQFAGRCVIISEIKNDEIYGCIVDAPYFNRLTQRVTLVCHDRIKINRITEQFIESVSRNIEICEGEIIEDKFPTSEAVQNSLIELTNSVFAEFHNKLAQTPEIVQEEIKRRYENEPFLSQFANRESKLKFAESCSLYIASMINANSKNPAILYSTNTQERLEWCMENIKKNTNPVALFRKDAGGIMPLIQFIGFFILCIAILLGSKYWNKIITKISN